MPVIRTLILFFIFSLFLMTEVYAKSAGPYSGQVLDSMTGEPVAGASVLLYWVNCLPGLVIECSSELVKASVKYTDHEGRYEFSRQNLSTGLLGSLEYTYITIYQPGYSAYTERKVHIWPSEWSRPAPTFPETDNVVRLERIPPGFDHKKHYERIEDSLFYLDDFMTSDTTDLMGNPLSDQAILEKEKLVVERWELLRRAQWEKRAGDEK